jgi:hemerythrin-like metal-binding protein
MKVGHGYEVVDDMVDRLLAYALQHFDTEEGLMRASSYPYLAAHEREHREFSDRVSEMERRRRHGQLLPSSEMMDFLCTWLRDHVLDSDKDFGLFMKRQARICGCLDL